MRRLKTLHCSRCKTRKTVPMTYPFKTCPQCREAKKEYKRRIERQKLTEEPQTTLENGTDLGVYSQEVVSDLCIEFRERFLKGQRPLPLELIQHHVNCKYCQLFYSENRVTFPKGVALW